MTDTSPHFLFIEEVYEPVIIKGSAEAVFVYKTYKPDMQFRPPVAARPPMSRPRPPVRG